MKYGNDHGLANNHGIANHHGNAHYHGITCMLHVLDMLLMLSCSPYECVSMATDSGTGVKMYYI